MIMTYCNDDVPAAKQQLDKVPQFEKIKGVTSCKVRGDSNVGQVKHTTVPS